MRFPGRYRQPELKEILHEIKHALLTFFVFFVPFVVNDFCVSMILIFHSET